MLMHNSHTQAQHSSVIVVVVFLIELCKLKRKKMGVLEMVLRGCRDLFKHTICLLGPGGKVLY